MANRSYSKIQLVSFTTEVQRGSATPEQVRVAWDDVLTDAGRDASTVHDFLRSHGVTLEDLSGTTVSVEQRSGDFGASLLVVVLGGVAVNVVKSLGMTLYDRGFASASSRTLATTSSCNPCSS